MILFFLLGCPTSLIPLQEFAGPTLPPTLEDRCPGKPECLKIEKEVMQGNQP
jgi:hypothetical protein